MTVVQDTCIMTRIIIMHIVKLTDTHNVQLTGVTSKKATGALRMLSSNFLWRTLAAQMPP